MFVIVLSTSVRSWADVRRLETAMKQYRDLASYSIDLGDEDRVLRVVCDQDISSTLSASLRNAMIGCSLMAVFQRCDA